MRSGTRRRRSTLASRPGEGIGQHATLPCPPWSFAPSHGRLAVPVASSRAAPGSRRTGPRRAAGGQISRSSTSSLRRPPGGGHQFLRALVRELGARGLDIEHEPGVRAARPHASSTPSTSTSRGFGGSHGRTCRMVHRVDGPIGVYRGFDDGTDGRIAAINGALADATILQSRYSLEKHLELGLDLRSSSRHPERSRSRDLPSARAPRAARREEGPADRGELVGQPAQGSRDARVARSAPRLGALRDDLRRARAGAARAHPFGRAGHAPARWRSCFVRTTCTSRRAGTIPARTRSSRRSPAACRRRSSRAEATLSWSAKAGCPSRRTRSFRTCSTVSSRRSRSGGRRSRSRRSPRWPTGTSPRSLRGQASA